MKITSNSIVNDCFKKEVGKYGSQSIKGVMPNYSFHLAWSDLPKNTKSLSLIFIDYDAIPVCGFPWIHWTVANIDPTLKELPENMSMEKKLLEGTNSWGSGIIPADWQLSREEATSYGGCAPPDKDHLYTIRLYALDTTLSLKSGFFMNELRHGMKGHILDKATLEAWYRS